MGLIHSKTHYSVVGISPPSLSILKVPMGLYTWSCRITSRFIGWCTFGAVPDETHQYTSHMKPMLATEPYVRDLVYRSSAALICECSHLITHIIYFLINPESNLKVYLHASFSFICHE